MGDNKAYRDYFAIDEKYYASVTAKLIEEGKVSWKQFYPHETFVDLLEKTHTVLSGKETRSLWVEGAYGTGKSHAALTVKSLLEASDDEIRDYFQDYGLNKDLGEKLIADKNNGQLITVHRIGSASIHSDDDLIIAIQESITEALEKHHIENHGESSLRDAALKWLEKEANKNYFGQLIAEEKYAWEFSGKTIDAVIDELKSEDSSKTDKLMHSLMKVAKDNGVRALTLDTQGMAEWLRTVIKANNLNAILFIWDEFTEFFQNNRNSLTGFQTLVEVSESAPFYFMIVSHESRSLFATADDAKKILGRFVPPVKIELPENMAFRLMAQAMKKTADVALAAEWSDYAIDLNEDLIDARQIITESLRKSGFGDKTHLQATDLENIVPIHPYAALLLKHISVVFSSNQRSMFDFIISNDMKSRGFKWYIENYGPLDTKNLLTVDMLWDFFCIQGQSGLTDDVRNILDSYNLVDNDRFNDDEKRVFKTILLLQSIAQRVGNVELLKPNDRNIDLAFAGTDWAQYKAHSIADKMVTDQVLFKRPAGSRTEYIVALNTNDHSEIDKLKESMRKEKKTKNLIVEAGLPMVLSLPKAYANRYDVQAVSVDDFTKTTHATAQQDWKDKFPIILSFATNESEAERLTALIEQSVKDDKNKDIIFIDTSSSQMGMDSYEKYIESMAYSRYYAKSDSKQAVGFNNQASDTLKAWMTKIQNGSFVLYNTDNLSGLRCANIQVLGDELKKIDRLVYPYGLEQYTVIDQMFTKGPLAQGAGCGIEQKLAGQFKSSNKQMSLENIMSGVWEVPDYWKNQEKQSLPIVKAKLEVESMIEKSFKEEGRISILRIFERLMQPKFGYMPCNITAFVMGFLLKEYTTGDFFWSNGSTSTPMSVDKMKTMIANGINEFVTPNRKYKEEFLVAMSAEQSAFLKATAKIFHINPEVCGSIEQARDHIRIAMRKMSFPFWCVKYVLDMNAQLVTPKAIISEAIDWNCGLANNANIGKKTESDLANDLGKLYLANPALSEDLSVMFKDELTTDGMIAYIKQFRGGALIDLSMTVGDNGKYIDVVKKKFSAEAANWVWNSQTADEKIDRVILEYNIVKESNLSLPKCSNIKECISQWNQKTSKFKISYEAIADMVGDLKPFLDMLYKIQKQTYLADQDKEQFYELLKLYRTMFDDLYLKQFEYFEKIAEIQLKDLNAEDRAQFFAELGAGKFTLAKNEYIDYIAGKVKEFLANQAKGRLKMLWNEKTGTRDPREWSNKYRTPILCMFDDAERRDARKYFGILNAPNPSNDDVEKAIAYIENANFFEWLSNQAYRDKCFMNRVVGEYAVLLGEPESIRDFLAKESGEAPSRWFDNSAVTHKLAKKAEEVYQEEGVLSVLEVIDNMDAKELKRYIREMISDNVTVGIEILKNK